MNNKKFKSIFTILFMIWFITSLILFPIFATDDNSFKLLINFGQYFIVLSLLAFGDKKQNDKSSLWLFCHLTVGELFVIVHFVISVLPKFTDLRIIDIIIISISFISTLIGYILLILSRNKKGKLFDKLYLKSIISFIIGLFIIIGFCLK